MDEAQPKMKEIFGPLDLGLMDRVFDPYDRMNDNPREGVAIITGWIKPRNGQLTVVQEEENSQAASIRGI